MTQEAPLVPTPPHAEKAPSPDLITGLLKDIALVLKIAGGLVGLTSAIFFFRRMTWRQVRTIRATFREPKRLRSHLRLAARGGAERSGEISWLMRVENWFKARRMISSQAGPSSLGEVSPLSLPEEEAGEESEGEEDSARRRAEDWRGLHMRRQREVGLIRSILRQEPSGPVVVTGASGSGKSSMVREILNDRPWTLYLNLQADPVGGSTDFLSLFTKASGYYFPPIELVALGILRQQISEHDAEKALHYTTIVLQQQRSLRNAVGDMTEGPLGVPYPVICVDQMHDIPVSPSSGSLQGRQSVENKEDQAATARAVSFHKFVEWAVYVTDAKLAHVIFVTRPGLISAMDKNLSLRFRREQVYLALMSESMANAYFRYQVNSELTRLGLPKFSDGVITRIVDTLGGNLKDIEQFLSAVLRGRPYKSVLRSMVRDSSFSLEMEMDDLLVSASSEAPGSLEQKEAYKRFLRFWDLLEYMGTSSGAHVPRRELISAVFLSAAHELEEYVTRGVLAHTDVAQHFFQNALLKEETEALEAEARAEREDELSTADKALEEAMRADDHQRQRQLYALQGGLDEHWVMLSAPRLKVAARKLTQDPRLLRLRRVIARAVHNTELRTKQERVLDQRSAIASEISALARTGQPSSKLERKLLGELERLVDLSISLEAESPQ